jgi:hypothetical protein
MDEKLTLLILGSAIGAVAIIILDAIALPIL